MWLILGKKRRSTQKNFVCGALPAALFTFLQHASEPYLSLVPRAATAAGSSKDLQKKEERHFSFLKLCCYMEKCDNCQFLLEKLVKKIEEFSHQKQFVMYEDS